MDLARCLRLTGAGTIACILVACSSAATPIPGALPAQPQQSSLTVSNGRLSVRIHIPKARRHKLGPAYISPATRAATFEFIGRSGTRNVVTGLTASSAGCTAGAGGTLCSINLLFAACPQGKNCYTATVKTYDAYDAANNSVPAGAHELSSAQLVPFTIRAKQRNIVALTLEGVPASVAFVPTATSTLSGNQRAGFRLEKCAGIAQSVSVLAIDADGNYILGPGAPAVTLASSTSQLAVSPLSPSAPNRFVLTPPTLPALPNGNRVAQLTATATPRGSVAAPVSANVNVTFTGNICGKFTEYQIPTPDSHPSGISAGPDGALWFTEEFGTKIGRITTTGAISEYSTGITPFSAPRGIAAGADGAMWFTECESSNIGRITTSGVITETGVGGTVLTDITRGPDNTMWFTEFSTATLGRIGAYGIAGSVGSMTAGSHPYGIAAGPDGNLWFTECATGKIASMPPTGGAATEYATPTANSRPAHITNGPDGALWFTEGQQSKVGRITTTGQIDEYPVPGGISTPVGITAGPDGGVWFVANATNEIDRVSTSGEFTQYSIPSPMSNPQMIALGADGSLWFTEAVANRIGRLQ